ncbi:hypothetical protein [Chryseobacterium indoltheticum]|uniref:hypothetical protein n=1 Tax=Chryseobacterium indoltheticum TaxID=254 RepID=UPI004042C3FF
MKKIILGLFLTTGISGITLANKIKEENNSSSKKEVSKKVNSKSPKGSCEYTTVTKYVDTCGSFQGRVSSWPTWMECPAGVQTGTRITTNVTVTVGPVKRCASVEQTDSGTGM